MTAAGAARNITRHYDLSNDLFATFLDESMSYSAALFTDEHTTLVQAQGHKIERLLDETGVQRGTRLLEIGTGWGELALRAARRGAHVTSLTLSNEQAALARRRVAASGIGRCGRYSCPGLSRCDRNLRRHYQCRDGRGGGGAVVAYLFPHLDQCLAPGGRIGIQAITMAHDRLLATKSSWTWIHKYIFPGGLIPSELAIRDILADCTSLGIVDRLSFGQSYARTLACWRGRFDGG